MKLVLGKMQYLIRNNRTAELDAHHSFEAHGFRQIILGTIALCQLNYGSYGSLGGAMNFKCVVSMQPRCLDKKKKTTFF